MVGTDNQGTYQVVGGTGRYQEAIGEGTIHSEVSSDGGKNTGRKMGFITLASPPLPELKINKNQNTIQISWDTTSDGFTLEMNKSLHPENWNPVTGVTENQVTLTIEDGAGFFRLVHE